MNQRQRDFTLFFQHLLIFFIQCSVCLVHLPNRFSRRQQQPVKHRTAVRKNAHHGVRRFFMHFAATVATQPVATGKAVAHFQPALPGDLLANHGLHGLGPHLTLADSGFVMLQVRAGRAHHPKPAKAVAQADRN